MFLEYDFDTAELIKKAGAKPREIDTDAKFYEEFRKSLEIPKTWNHQVVKSDPATEYFCYKTKLYCDENKHFCNIISYVDDDKVKFAITYRELLIDLYNKVDFYKDVSLNYFLETVYPKLGSPWRYVKMEDQDYILNYA